MAIRPYNKHKPLHTCYIAGTGGGKSTAVKLLAKMLDLFGDCVAGFDLYREYGFDGRKTKDLFNGLGQRPVYHYSTRKTFASAFIDAWRSGKKFVVFYSPEFPSSLKDDQLRAARKIELEWFGQLMWEALDGNRRLDILVEEYAKLVDSVAKDSSIIGEIATGGRKFGAVLHTVFQRSQEVPKTIWNNSPRKILGGQESMDDAKAVAKELDAAITDVIALGRLNQKYEDERMHYIAKLKGGIGNICPYRLYLETGKVEKMDFDELTSA
ncbi:MULTISPECIES: hypothetical protein [unclassified Pseudoalteromonas]|uniref:hypothetical protein n=1 Tax=unclassified Pseudoalteromonas TaxID=194690 RepID=UPI001F1F7356|nr:MULTISPECIES: hypothetical protein [unclassified Pseudoalteromonas]MCF2826814.1 hypothetical protein [Pseudoalteromonas sp. OF5H-5]MCF2834519.1 hypothetical protein [Pseudoalteromonas sp. DL2-H6]MCF2924057.1 hypothetical protein [Pseudoalteromonas sp. DL2-H1]